MKKLTVILLISLSVLSSRAQENLLLKDYEPNSIYNIPKTRIEKAKFGVVDFHTHPYAKSEKDIDDWVKTMDKFGIEKSIILSYSTGNKFDSLYAIYSKYGNRFEVWCGFDYTGYNEKGWSDRAIKELERCYKVGATGVGELGDKGLGLFYSYPSPAFGMHIDDERMKPLLKKCGELGLPINIHVAEPIWMYEPMDKHNDGLMNAFTWRIEKKEGLLSHQQLINGLENAVKDNPTTKFIACHFANCSYDLNIIGRLLDAYPNLYADISARYAETAATPRATKAFYEKHQDKLLYGTDMGKDSEMYATTLRILETEDEHFYDRNLFSYHWPLHGLGLSSQVLEKLYSINAKNILHYKP